MKLNKYILYLWAIAASALAFTGCNDFWTGVLKVSSRRTYDPGALVIR